MSKLNESARAAFQIGDYKLAANNWVTGHALPDDEEELTTIFKTAERVNQVSPDPDLCGILGLMALDYDEIFASDREDGLLQCIEWSKTGLRIDPDHYICNRHAGSAFYWLNDWEAAIPYYKKAISIAPSPVLQIRLFKMYINNHQAPDFSKFEIDYHTPYAMEAYNAAVKIKNLLNEYQQIPQNERYRIQQLKMRCYENAYHLYDLTLSENNGNPLNDDPHTFAMCCNNLALEWRTEGRFNEAIAVASKGMEYSYFLYIIQNRFGAYVEGGYFEEAVIDGESMLEDFIEEMEATTYFNILDNVIDCLMKLKNYQSALAWIKIGQESYYALDPSGGVASSNEAVQFFTNTFIHKTKAEEALGMETNLKTSSIEMDNILSAMPDNPTILISRANNFMDEENYVKALECLQYALHFASKHGKSRSAQVALYNMGYIHTAKFGDNTAGLENFEQSIAMGNNDFWCLYWAVHCCYHLQENEKTIAYATKALEALAGEEKVKNDIIAELYEHLGTSLFDLERYAEAECNLRISLQYHHVKITEDNLIAATRELKRSQGSNVFNKLFGQ